jgi:hypothetical protein
MKKSNTPLHFQKLLKTRLNLRTTKYKMKNLQQDV